MAFGVDVRHRAGRLVVAPRGELDIATVRHVRQRLEGRRAAEPVELDLRRVDFMDTSGLQLIVELHRRAVADGFALTIVRGTADVQRVIEMAGLDGVLPFTDAAADHDPSG